MMSSQRMLAGFPLLVVGAVAMLWFTGSGLSHVAAAAFPVLALVTQQFVSRRPSASESTAEVSASRWLWLPAVVLTVWLAPTGLGREMAITEKMRLVGFVVAALAMPSRWGGWETP